MKIHRNHYAGWPLLREARITAIVSQARNLSKWGGIQISGDNKGSWEGEGEETLTESVRQRLRSAALKARRTGALNTAGAEGRNHLLLGFLHSTTPPSKHMILSSTVHSSLKVEATPGSINTWMDNPCMVHLQSGMSFNFRRKESWYMWPHRWTVRILGSLESASHRRTNITEVYICEVPRVIRPTESRGVVARGWGRVGTGGV